MSKETFFLLLSLLTALYGCFSVWNRNRIESEIVWFLLSAYFLLPWFLKGKMLPWYVFPLYLLPPLALFGAMVYLAYKNKEYGRLGAETECRSAVLLGCKVGSLAFQFREDKAYEYLMMHEECSLICSGAKGSDEPVSEAEAYYTALINRGISKERLKIEDQSFSTFENLRNSLELLNHTEESAAIITQEYHLARSYLIAKKAGYQNPAMIAAYSIPVHHANYLLREVLAIIYGKLRGRL